MTLHTEIHFENDVCQHLAESGWLYAEGDNQRYDRARALYLPDLVEWLKQSDPKAWETLVSRGGEAAAVETLAKRLRSELDKQGTLQVLRKGFDVLGVKNKIQVVQFKPALAMNPDIVAKYEANRLRVVRQVYYSEHNQNSIDLVLFLNGLPIATAELKTDFTQSVEDAVLQYKQDRLPNPPGQTKEPLLSFPSGALVHFAVSTEEVRMTTKLQGGKTFFLPFNQGDQGPGKSGGKGNPSNPDGYKTGYLWREVWERESWLEILGRYLISERDEKKELKSVIFPRFHQLDATRKLQQAILNDRPGSKYLVQHSAGSGKTKSIAWTANFLGDLHDTDHRKVFDTVLVISDRKVIDGQLQGEIEAFQRTDGVVATITGNQGSKSEELATALKEGKKIVVCTIQTFPFALEQVRELAATEGKRFVVIADEAHSSQTGAAASKLKMVLSEEEQQELEDGGEVSSDDILAAHMASRAEDAGITYIAFTATPKAKTLELFGTRPHPDQPPGEGNLPTAFHVYSMRQAIEEGFILDVLRNYTSYKVAFKLAHNGQEFEDIVVERSAAVKGLMNWVRLHPYNISQKVEVVVEHFRSTVAPLLEGQAKAMVVVSSRLEAVRWKLAVDKYISTKGYPMKTLVAFSGEVDDKESGPEPFTEKSEVLNGDLKRREIKEVFKDGDQKILLVANKFQTGFDQPLLCGMYVDKRLAGIQAVQTLSRLNRCHPGKDETYVVDFVNDSQEILKAFKTYYETAELADETDPNLILDLRAKLDATGYYTESEIDRVVNVVLDPNATQKQLQAAVKPTADRLVRQFAEAKETFKEAEESKDSQAAESAKNTMEALKLFRGDMTTYLRAYTFLSQIFDYGNTDFEKRAIFYKDLVRLLKFGLEREGVDLSEVVLTRHAIHNRGKQVMQLNQGEAEQLQPITEAGQGKVNEKQKALLSEIIEKLNDVLGSDTTEGDKLQMLNGMVVKLCESEELREQALNNNQEQLKISPNLDKAFVDAVLDIEEAQGKLRERALKEENRPQMIRILFECFNLYEKLRGEGQSA